MQSNFAKVALVVVAAAAAIVLFVVLGDDDSDEGEAQTTSTIARDQEDEKKRPRGEDVKEATEEIPRITIIGGQPQGGVQELEFTAGDEVRFEVVSDIAEHVHVHGYDVIQDVEPGKPAVFAFPADTDGVFEVELEDSATPIAELKVNPG
jgi:heme/copper-type cytochrome/quinol oxidase subunit 2